METQQLGTSGWMENLLSLYILMSGVWNSIWDSKEWLIIFCVPAVYLCKRTMQNKARLELADYEAVSTWGLFWKMSNERDSETQKYAESKTTAFVCVSWAWKILCSGTVGGTGTPIVLFQIHALKRLQAIVLSAASLTVKRSLGDFASLAVTQVSNSILYI